MLNSILQVLDRCAGLPPSHPCPITVEMSSLYCSPHHTQHTNSSSGVVCWAAEGPSATSSGRELGGPPVVNLMSAITNVSGGTLRPGLNRR